MGNLLSGYHVTCATLPADQNTAFNERAALVFLVVSVSFIGWRAISCIRQHVETLQPSQNMWYECFRLWPAFGLIVDQASPAMFSAAMGLAIAPNLCYTQPLIVASQFTALAIFTHASSWMFVETVSELVTQLIALLSVLFPVITIWTVAQQIADNPAQGWYCNHDPRWYLLTGIILEAIVIAFCLLWYALRLRALHGGALITPPPPVKFRDTDYQMGWSGIVARRAGLLARDARPCIQIMTWTKVIFITALVAVASMITGIRAIFTFRDAVHYNKADKQASLYSAASWSVMFALLVIHPISVVFMALISKMN